MLTGIPALEQTDWAKLYHAYGSAADTPKHLRALLDEDAGGREAALDHLWSAVIHQGTPWTVTGPAACVIVGLLADERIDRGEMPLRAPLLQFLVSVAEAGEQTGRSIDELERMAVYNSDPVKTWDEAFENDDDAACNAFYARSILGCMEVAPLLLETMERDLRSPDPRVRSYAAMGASTLAKASSLSNRAKDIEERLRNMAQTAEDTDERSALVLALGELDASPSAFLRDPSPAVRMCAALAPKLAEDAVATEVLIKSLEKAGEIDTWFAATPPQNQVSSTLRRSRASDRTREGIRATHQWRRGSDPSDHPLLCRFRLGPAPCRRLPRWTRSGRDSRTTAVSQSPRRKRGAMGPKVWKCRQVV